MSTGKCGGDFHPVQPKFPPRLSHAGSTPQGQCNVSVLCTGFNIYSRTTQTDAYKFREISLNHFWGGNLIFSVVISNSSWFSLKMRKFQAVAEIPGWAKTPTHWKNHPAPTLIPYSSSISQITVMKYDSPLSQKHEHPSLCATAIPRPGLIRYPENEKWQREGRGRKSDEKIWPSQGCSSSIVPGS